MSTLSQFRRVLILAILALASLDSARAVEVIAFSVPSADLEKVQAAAPKVAKAKPQKLRKLLVFSGAAGYWHSSIPIGALAIENMGKQTHAFETVITTDTAAFDPAFLKEFDAVHLNNVTGVWLTDETRKQALLDFVRSGKGLSGQHSCTDAFHDNAGGMLWPEFNKMIGAIFNGHPWDLNSTVDVCVEDAACPIAQNTFPERFRIQDEIYQFREPYSRKNLRVIMALDKDKMQLKEGLGRTDQDFAVSWIREEGKGRVFYTSLGHREDIYWNPEAMQYLLNGIQYALGDLAADATPSEK